MADRVLEKNVVKSIRGALKRKGGFWFKVHGGPRQIAGIPDLIGCYRGHFFGLEVKVPSRESKASPLQLATIKLINEAGGTAAVVTSKEQALKIVEDWERESSD